MGIGENALYERAPEPEVGTWIQTYSGVAAHPLALEAEQVRLIDVAHALSLAARFAGHTLRGYSVGEHSLNTAEIVGIHEYVVGSSRTTRHIELVAADIGDTVARLRWQCRQRYPGVAELGRLAVAVVDSVPLERAPLTAWRIMRGLGHDASEAYLVDVPTPIKAQMAEYKRLERIAQAACDARLQVRPADLETDDTADHDLVKSADLAVLFVEKSRLLVTDRPDWSPALPRDPYWGRLAHAVVSGYPGQLTHTELRMYAQVTGHLDGEGQHLDPHSAPSVRAAFWHLHAFLEAVLDDEHPASAAREYAQGVIL